MARVFVSHSSKDNQICTAILAELEGQDSNRIFVDFDHENGLQPGEDWERRLYDEIQACQAVILIITKNWIASKWCYAEYTLARSFGKAIFPLNIESGLQSGVSNTIQATDLSTDRQLRIAALQRKLREVTLVSPEGFDLPDGVSPFPGLESFDEKRAAVFYGRDPEVIGIIESLRQFSQSKFVVLLGESGSGKSSLLLGGVLPRLSRQSDEWIVLPPFRPGVAPFERLVEALGASSIAHGPWSDLLLSDRLEQAIDDISRSLVSESPSARILISIDQVEELFSENTSESRTSFIRLLGMLLRPGTRFRAVGALRSAFLNQLQSVEGRDFDFRVEQLDPMPVVRIEALIRGPARVAKVPVEDDFVATLISDVRATRAGLPLVAFVLSTLYRDSAPDYRLTLRGYESLADRQTGLTPLESAVRLVAERALPIDDFRRSALLPSQRDMELADLFVPALVRINLTTGELVRRLAYWGDIPVTSWPLAERLINERLLLSKADGAGSLLVEVVHESLFALWPKLSEILSREREFLVTLQRLDDAIADWNSLPDDRRSKALAGGIQLERLRRFIGTNPHRFTVQQKQFIFESIEFDQREQNERERAYTDRDSALRSGKNYKTAIRVVILVAGAAVAVFAYNTYDSLQKVRKYYKLAFQSAADTAQIVKKVIPAGTKISYLNNDDDGKGISDKEIVGRLMDLQKKTFKDLPMDEDGPNELLHRLNLFISLAESHAKRTEQLQTIQIADEILQLAENADVRRKLAELRIPFVIKAKVLKASILVITGNVHESLSLAQDAIRLTEVTYRINDGNVDLVERSAIQASAYEALGDAWRPQKKLVEALNSYRKALLSRDNQDGDARQSGWESRCGLGS